MDKTDYKIWWWSFPDEACITELVEWKIICGKEVKTVFSLYFLFFMNIHQVSDTVLLNKRPIHLLEIEFNWIVYRRELYELQT